MLFTNATTETSDLQILLGNEYLKFTDCSMFLGVKLDNKLKFSKHTSDVSSKLSKNIGIFSKIYDKLPPQARLSYFYSFIYPYLTYNVTFWGKTYNRHTDPIVKLQKRMLRLMTNSGFFEHTNPLFFQLKILKFPDIYTYFVCIYMHQSISNGKYRIEHSLNTRARSNNHAQPIFNRLTSAQQSISIMGPNTWNSLPAYLRNIRDLVAFKTKLKTYLIDQYAPS